MATHEQNIEALRTAVYGASVRNSMVELFEEDYNLTKNTISIGTSVTGPTSSIVGYTDGNVYVNSSTWDVYQCDGTKWVLKGNIKGAKGFDGSGNKWYTGNKISGKFSGDKVFQYSEISYAYVGDLYLNEEEGAIYKCVEGGSNFLAKWRYSFTMQDATSGDMKMEVYANSGDVGVVNAANALTRKAIDNNTIYLNSNGILKSKQPTGADFLSVFAQGWIEDNESITLDLDRNKAYIMILYGYRSDNYSVRGIQAFILGSPNNMSASQTVVGTQIGSTAGASVATVTYGENSVTIKPYSSSSYYAKVNVVILELPS